MHRFAAHLRKSFQQLFWSQIGAWEIDQPCVARFLSSLLSDPRRRPSGELDILLHMGLSTLPYDLLLNIALFLDLRDIHALHLTCKTLNDFTTTRPVYRKLATDLLRKCRALPLKGFQRLTDLTTEQLIRSVNQAARYDNAWRKRAPKPIGSLTSTYGTAHYMDGPSNSSALTHPPSHPTRTWYKVVSAPPDEEVDWLSPITSSYTLCATKSGKVVCWDVQSDSCLAEWNPGERWELWKCRVEFDERTVYFTMAKILDTSQDDNRVMEFVLMRLTFSDPPSGVSSTEEPKFSRVTEFRTTGVVMNIFLLDPSERLLSAFVWCSGTNTIGLYALLDWSKPEYVFVDTGIEYAVSANWSCILYDQHIVIHCEEPEAAHQYFYPFSLLRSHSAYLPNRLSHPKLTGLVRPARVLTKKFVFPRILPQEPLMGPTPTGEDGMTWLSTLSPHMVLMLPSTSPTQAIGAAQLAPIPSTAATAGATPPPGVSLIATSSSSGLTNGAVVSSPVSVPTPPLSAQSLAANSPSASGLTPTPIPTPGAPLIPHASLPPQPHSPTSFFHYNPHASSPPQTPLPNPFPFPTWYPESAHFVRQWWPTLSGIPRVSCTVVLLAMHDQETHRNRFVLAQHYFKVPIDWGMWVRGEATSDSDKTNGTGGSTATGTSSDTDSPKMETREGDDELMKMWYVSKPFEVVRVFDGRDDDDNAMIERPRPLVAVDFGHAVWIEYDDEAAPPPPPPPLAHLMSHLQHHHTTASTSPTVASTSLPGANTGIHIQVDYSGDGTGVVVPLGSEQEGHDFIGHGEAVASSHLTPYDISQDEDLDHEPEPEADIEPKVLKFVTFPGYEDGYEDEWIEEEIEVEVEVDAEEMEEVEVQRSTPTKGGKGKQRACDLDGDLENGLGPRTRSKTKGKAKGKGKENTRNGGIPVTNGTSSSSSAAHTNGTHFKTPSSSSVPQPRKILKKKKVRRRRRRNRETEGVVRTLEVPEELDLGTVETINIDQSQGAVILSDREGKIFILCYE
ncbi:hypothetical protein D9756_005595 [Leucocoprinus leucothites]|uniref:F-box domain-containing protein n=1 Tax=Leucocoprinus leucothites TaxID=201217 RepID=A0A8H5D7T8_9AGAR|nr:hypothetical protein D9756_005595 [Leucoagaricus leucothites]